MEGRRLVTVCLRLSAALRLAVLLACLPRSAASVSDATLAPNLTGSGGAGEAAAATAPVSSEDMVSGSGNMSFVDEAAQGPFYRCGALLCIRPSVCCMSKTLRNEVSGVHTAICCAPDTACRFMFFNKTSGIRTINKKGMGEPRCFACGWWRLRYRGAQKTGCENRCGGSICCGGNRYCAATWGRKLLGASDGEQR